MEAITKVKNPKRVEAGKKAYEQHLIKLKGEHATPSDTPPTPSATPSPSASDISSTWAGGTLVVILAVIAAGAYFVYAEKLKPPVAPVAPKTDPEDIFKML